MERGAQGKEKSEEGAVWHQEGEILSMVMPGAQCHVHEVGPGYTFRNANSF